MTSKQLLLLRHAKSDWHSGARDDFERPLSARGRRDAAKMGRFLRENRWLPDCIVASPSARTTETVELVCAALDASADNPNRRIGYDAQLYHGGPDRIQVIAAAQLARCSRLLLVAHNPGMEMALLDWCPNTAPFPDGKFMPTCALGVIEFADDGKGKLRRLLRPSELPETD